MILKVGEGYRVVAESGRNMGTYATKEEAERRLRQMVLVQIRFSKTSHLGRHDKERVYFNPVIPPE